MTGIETDPTRSIIPRRTILRRAVQAGAASLAAGFAAGVTRPHEAAGQAEAARPTPGRIRQSMVHWCFSPHWPIEQMIEVAQELGIHSIELLPIRHFPLLVRHGLECAIAGVEVSQGPSFARGWNQPAHWEELIASTRRSIEASAEHGFRRVIAFTGMRDGLSDEEGMANCVEGLRKVVGYAEDKEVTICLEMLNSRDDSHPMKGHPGYQGDHVDYCFEIIRRVGSPHLKLLFDIYHVQIMDGDIIRRIRQNAELIGHIHTAGNPGRGELDDRQEINYPAVIKALVDAGYDGFVGHEFIPTRDPREGLRQAVQVSTVG